ncbi:NAD-dependent epimerase/dehydratase family protein [Thermodesulfobacteriota bacterium]
MKKQTVLVAGGAGCVGSFVVEELLDKGYHVVAMDLPGSPLPSGNERLKTIEGDLTAPGFIEKCLKGVDHIINAAAIVDIGKSYADLEPVNLGAVKRLHELGRARKVKRLIHISTGSVYAESDAACAETSPMEIANDYVRTKVESEEFLMGKPKGAFPRSSVLRPALVYGPKGKVLMAMIATMPPLFRGLGMKFVPLSGGPKTNMVHGRDVAGAAVFLLTKRASWGEIYNIADDDVMHFTEFVNIACEVFGLTPRGISIPYPPMPILKKLRPFLERDETLAPMNVITDLLWGQIVKEYGLENELSLHIDKEQVAFWVRDAIFGNDKIKELGYELKYPRFRPGWTMTTRWYEENRWIPRVDEMTSVLGRFL